MSRGRGFLRELHENRDSLLRYSTLTSPDHIITAQELEEYKQAQRELMIYENLIFWILKNDQKTEPTFITAKIEHVASEREFYVTQICHLEMRDTFQIQFNDTYKDDCEPINNLRVKDLCAVLYDLDWYRAEVIEIFQDQTEDCRITVHLIDYGSTVSVTMAQLCVLKQPHVSIVPFAIKCRLSSSNADDDELMDLMKPKLTRRFKRFSKRADQVSIYLNGIVPGKQDIYDVTLIADSQTELKSRGQHDVHLLHEVLAAFIRSPELFDDEICYEWSKTIPQMSDKSSMDLTKKVQIHISHIISPMEIYVKCNAAEAFMMKIRRIIDGYVNKYAMIVIKGNWSVGEDCLVRLQNWKTESNIKLWYRGRIVGRNPEQNTFDIFLRDYGRTAEVKNIDLLPIPPKICRPFNAIQKCRLEISNVWTDSSTNTFLQIINDYRKFAISCNSKDEDGCLVVTLWARNSLPETMELEKWDNIGLRIISQSIIESMQPFIEKSKRRYLKYKFKGNGNSEDESDTAECSALYDEFFTPLDENLSTVGDGHNPDDDLSVQEPIVYRWPSPPPSQRTFCGFVTHITETGTIYVQEESNSEAAYELARSITLHLKKTNPLYLKSQQWNKSEACFAEYGVDGYYRAVVNKINHEEGTCLIHFVDYGNDAQMRLDDLYPATKFSGIPILVQRYYIPKLVPLDKSGKWCSEVFKEFRSKLINKMCNVCVDDIINIEQFGNQILPCTIEPTSLPCDIYNWLLKMKLGLGTGLSTSGEGILYV